MIEAPTSVTPGDVTIADEQPRRRRRGILALLLGLTTLSLGAGMFSLAVFTDSDTSTGTFEAGTIDIESNPTVAFTVTGMVPGDFETQPLTISNDGSADLRYAMTAAAPDLLGGTLTLEVREEGTDCATFDGAVVMAETVLDGAAFGDPTQGIDAGDRDIAALGSEVLCFKVSLPLATGDGVQGESSSATFTFNAEQTANNP